MILRTLFILGPRNRSEIVASLYMIRWKNVHICYSEEVGETITGLTDDHIGYKYVHCINTLWEPGSLAQAIKLPGSPGTPFFDPETDQLINTGRGDDITWYPRVIEDDDLPWYLNFWRDE